MESNSLKTNAAHNYCVRVIFSEFKTFDRTTACHMLMNANGVCVRVLCASVLPDCNGPSKCIVWFEAALPDLTTLQLFDLVQREKCQCWSYHLRKCTASPLHDMGDSGILWWNKNYAKLAAIQLPIGADNSPCASMASTTNRHAVCRGRM